MSHSKVPALAAYGYVCANPPTFAMPYSFTTSLITTSLLQAKMDKGHPAGKRLVPQLSTKLGDGNAECLCCMHSVRVRAGYMIPEKVTIELISNLWPILVMNRPVLYFEISLNKVEL